MARLLQFLAWWLWQRWNIYCPRRSVAHLFDQNRTLHGTPYGIMEFPSREDVITALFHYDEAFLSPCTCNEVWCGGFRGLWSPTISFVPYMDQPEDLDMPED